MKLGGKMLKLSEILGRRDGSGGFRKAIWSEVEEF
jgi:hypothetical protein